MEEAEPLKIPNDRSKERGSNLAFLLFGGFCLGWSKCNQDCNTVLDCTQFLLTHTQTHTCVTAFNQQFQIQLPTEPGSYREGAKQPGEN